MSASVVASPDVLEAALAAGRVRCPGCGGPLARWGHAREREVRMLSCVRSLRPRRARCAPCASTHVLLPAWSVPRRRDAAEVIGHALVQKARGAGHRAIARRLDRPPGTVRGWLRAFARCTQVLSGGAVSWTVTLGDGLSTPRPSGSGFVDAVAALACAERAWVLRFGRRHSPWELLVALSGGLLHGCPRPPPGC